MRVKPSSSLGTLILLLAILLTSSGCETMQQPTAPELTGVGRFATVEEWCSFRNIVAIAQLRGDGGRDPYKVREGLQWLAGIADRAGVLEAPDGFDGGSSCSSIE